MVALWQKILGQRKYHHQCALLQSDTAYNSSIKALFFYNKNPAHAIKLPDKLLITLSSWLQICLEILRKSLSGHFASPFRTCVCEGGEEINFRAGLVAEANKKMRKKLHLVSLNEKLWKVHINNQFKLQKRFSYVWTERIWRIFISSWACNMQ